MVLVAGVLASCTVGGTAVIAPYRSPVLGSLVATAVTSDLPGVLALSPDGERVAVADAANRVCVQPVRGGSGLCAPLPLTGRHLISAAFSSDGQLLAVGSDVTAQRRGSVWLLDVGSGALRGVPQIAGAGAGAGAGGPSLSGGPSSSVGATASPATSAVAPSTSAEATGSSYVGLSWDAGDLLLVSSSLDPDGPRTRLVDVDPQSMIPRVVAQATGPYEFQSGHLAVGGPSVAFTVVRGDQIPPNLVVVDLQTGARRELGPLGAGGTQLVPLAVSPDGRLAIAGSASYPSSGPPRLLDLASGRLADIPGLSGDFEMAAFSPNGSQLAVVTAAAGRWQVSIAAVSGGPPRTVSSMPARSDPGLLTWSDRNVLAIDGPGGATGSVLGFTLTG